MPNREQTQDQRNKKGQVDPGKFSPDDDEAQEADQTRAQDMGPGRKPRKSSIEEQPQIEDEEAEDDEEDDSDGRGAARP